MILQTVALTKSYPGVRALDALSLSFDGGTVGLLGPNGAGKSTLLRILLGLLRPTSGSARLLGIDPSREPLRARRGVGYMPESDSYVPGMSAVDFVALAGRLSGMTRTDALQRTHLVLNYLGVDEERYRPVDGFSTGMKQKVKLAQALVHHPRLLLLDEPTSGLDPRARIELLDLIRDLARGGMHVVLSTHILPDVERVCDSVAILLHGRLVRQGRLRELSSPPESGHVVRIRGDEPAFLAAVAEEGGRGERREDGGWRLTGPDAGSDWILRAAARARVQLRELGRPRTSLEELFARAVREAV